MYIPNIARGYNIMITKETFLEEKKLLEQMIVEEKKTMDKIVMNINKVTAALNWVNAELEKIPETPKKKKKGLFSKK